MWKKSGMNFWKNCKRICRNSRKKTPGGILDEVSRRISEGVSERISQDVFGGILEGMNVGILEGIPKENPERIFEDLQDLRRNS